MVEFELTEEQMEAILPLLKKVIRAYKSNHRGMIIAQLDGDEREECKAMFVPEKVSEKLIMILRDYQKRYCKKGETP